MKLTISLLQIFVISLVSHAFSALADGPTFQSRVTIPGTISDGTAVAQFTSDFFGPDALKISPITAPVTGWWYFDAVDENLEGTVDVFIYYTPELAANESTVSASISAHFGNGTAFDASAIAESAVVTTDGNASSAELAGIGVSWIGRSDAEHYEVRIDSPELGVSGYIAIESTAPGHYPCGHITPGESMALAPKFGFANVVPDGNVKVDLVLNGSSLSFTGIGYHDHVRTVVFGIYCLSANHSICRDGLLFNFHESLSSWYFGHARLGPYSIVWYDGLAPDGKSPIISAYAAKNGEVITAKCSGLTVRPFGHNSAYPPRKNTGTPNGFHITMDMGNGQILEANTPKAFSAAESEWYTRWIGTINWTVSGDGGHYHGVALFEEAVYY